jgi:hypothetical protein
MQERRTTDNAVEVRKKDVDVFIVLMADSH